MKSIEALTFHNQTNGKDATVKRYLATTIRGKCGCQKHTQKCGECFFA